MLTKIIKFACIGFLIGAVAGNVIAILTGTSSTEGITFASKQLLDMSGGNAAVAMILQSVFSGIYGALCFVGVVFYDIERLPLALATAAHCALIILSFIPISLFLGWADSVISVVIVAAIQFVAFFIIWFIMYSVYKKQVKEPNELQSKLNKDKNED